MGNAVWDALAPWRRRPPKPTPPTPPTPQPPPIQPPPGGTMTPIRVTDALDGELLNRGYSYWPQALVSGELIYVFVGHADGRPRFFSVHRQTGAVLRLGPVMPYTGTGEGWYWGADGKITLCDGPRLRRAHPFTGEDQIVFDISKTHPGCRLWQAHSSDDGQTHSATVQRIVSYGPYPNIGTIVCRHGQVQPLYEAQGKLDESQVTPCGGYLVIKENDDNRIITLATGEQRILTDAMGAVGHSDCGPGILVGEDNHRGKCLIWDLAGDLTVPRETFSTWNMGHVSVRGGRILVSHGESPALSLLQLFDEGGSTLTHLLHTGMVGSGYDFQVHGNLDPTGRVAMWMSNVEGRMDAWIMELPS